jgi:hypothetical protein
MTSKPEEDVMVLAALERLGESDRERVAADLGEKSVFRTLVRLEANGRVVSRERFSATLGRRERVFSVAQKKECAHVA